MKRNEEHKKNFFWNTHMNSDCVSVFNVCAICLLGFSSFLMFMLFVLWKIYSKKISQENALAKKL